MHVIKYRDCENCWSPHPEAGCSRFAGRIHRMIKLGLSIDDDDDAGDDDLPPLEEVEGADEEASKMEEVD